MFSFKKKENYLSELEKNGRYYTLNTRKGNKVHVLGVIPSSMDSMAEVKTLVDNTDPSIVYCDVQSSLLHVLADDVNHRQINDVQNIPSDREIPMAPFWEGITAPFRMLYALHKNDFFGLIGSEYYGPYKYALANVDKSRVVGLAPYFTFFSKEYADNPGHVTIFENWNPTHVELFQLRQSFHNYVPTFQSLCSFSVFDLENTSLRKWDPEYLRIVRTNFLQAMKKYSSSLTRLRDSDPGMEIPPPDVSAIDTRTFFMCYEVARLLDGTASKPDDEVLETSSLVTKSSGPASEGVVLVNLGHMDSFIRQWEYAQTLDELPAPNFLTSQAPAFLGFGILSLIHRRFPKTAYLGSALFLLKSAFLYYGMSNLDPGSMYSYMLNRKRTLEGR